MKIKASAIFSVSIVSLLFTQLSQAVNINYVISGSQSASENGCTFFAVQFLGPDCSYDNSDPSGFGTSWVGPEFDSGYYATGSSPGPSTAPSPGDGKVSLSINGNFRIDDKNTGTGTDDLLSGSWTIAAGTRSSFSGPSRFAEESWTSITHILDPTSVDSVVENSSGGFDYVIGSLGFPTPLAPDGTVNTAAFPSEVGSDLFAGTSAWSAPGAFSVARVEGNLGGVTTATATGYSCADTQAGADCANSPGVLGSSTGSFGYENFLLFLSTDASGNLISANAYFTQEFILPDNPTLPESWRAGTMMFTGAMVPVPPAIWLFGSAVGLLGWMRRKVA